MSLIKPRTRGKQLVRHITRLDRENNETLFAYAAFIGETTEYVLNQLVDTVLRKDKEFAEWRTGHPESFVGRLSPRRRSTSEHVPVGRMSPTAVLPARVGTTEAHV